MPTRHRHCPRPWILGALVLLGVGASAQEPSTSPALAQIKKNILNMNPETRVEKVDSDRLRVRRLDIVDDTGRIRMSLGAPTPPPILGGIQYKRAFPVSGVTLFDAQGNERGGFGVADIPGSALILASDHENVDAIGWRVMPDGAVTFSINQKPPVRREPALDNRMLPAVEAPTRISFHLEPDGTPSIALADQGDHPRLRLTVTPEGFGAIEFLDSQGKVIHRIAPEAESKSRPAVNP